MSHGVYILMGKRKWKKMGIPISEAARVLGVAYNTVVSIINRGELKLNDDDWIDGDSWDSYMMEWNKKPEWMRRGIAYGD